MNSLTTITVSLLLSLSSCAAWPVGEDPRGRELRSQANAVVGAIARYREANGVLPSSLNLLVPQFFQQLPAVAKQLLYFPDKGTAIYDYTSSWPRLGQTSCATVIGSGRWDCHGYL
jgi:hypothetical protein